MKKLFALLVFLAAILSSSGQNSPDPMRFVLDMVHHNPGEALTQSAYLEPSVLKSKGYNGKVFFLFDAAQFGVDWAEIDAEVFPEGSESRAWVEQRRSSIAADYEKAKAEGLGVYCMLDMLVMPRRLVETHKAEMTDENGKIDITKPFTQKCIRYMVNEMFETFPALDGLVIRTGETYLHGAPYHIGNHPMQRGLSDHVALINILRDEVCEANGKTLIYRTWDMGKLHSLPKHYLAVTDSVEPHPNLLFSIKHTITDFWRGVPDANLDYEAFDTYWLDESSQNGVAFNPCLGIGRHPQVVEVQCQREYEGKGAHPNYVAHGVIERFPEVNTGLSDLIKGGKLQGVWTWSRGGGWGGPYIPNELWIDLNASVMAAWAADPSRSEEEHFYDYAKAKGLNDEDARKLRKLCLLTEEGVLKGEYSSIGDFFVNWTRDATMTGDGLTGSYFDRIVDEGLTDAYIAEKKEAVEIWNEIVRLGSGLSFADEADSRFAAVSTRYGQLKYSILAKGFEIMLRGRESERVGRQLDRKAMADNVAEFDALVAEWQRLKDENPDCPTLYSLKADFFGHEVGLAAAVDKYREH